MMTALLVMCNQSTDPGGSTDAGDGQNGGDGNGEAVVMVRVGHCTQYDPCDPATATCRCPDYRGYSCQATYEGYYNLNGHPTGRYFVLNHTGTELASGAIGDQSVVTVPSGTTVTVKMLVKNATTGAIDTISDNITALDSLRWDFFYDTWSAEGPPTPCDTANIW
jgi:hypothetical protein